jgi:hypothetical protein
MFFRFFALFLPIKGAWIESASGKVYARKLHFRENPFERRIIFVRIGGLARRLQHLYYIHGEWHDLGVDGSIKRWAPYRHWWEPKPSDPFEGYVQINIRAKDSDGRFHSTRAVSELWE